MHDLPGPLDVDRLSHEGAELGFDFDLSRLSALKTLYPDIHGTVSGQVRFGREQDLAVARLSLRGGVTLQCQRCMGPLRRELDVAAAVALVGSEAEGARVPPQFEPVLAPGGRTSIEQLVSEELLLTLPSVPLHEEGAQVCTAVGPQPAEGETHRPFARLAELVKR